MPGQKVVSSMVDSNLISELAKKNWYDLCRVHVRMDMPSKLDPLSSFLSERSSMTIRLNKESVAQGCQKAVQNMRQSNDFQLVTIIQQAWAHLTNTKRHKKTAHYDNNHPVEKL
eukprot:2780117-Amphidinium_carterae.1